MPAEAGLGGGVGGSLSRVSSPRKQEPTMPYCFKWHPAPIVVKGADPPAPGSADPRPTGPWIRAWVIKCGRTTRSRSTAVSFGASLPCGPGAEPGEPRESGHLEQSQESRESQGTWSRARRAERVRAPGAGPGEPRDQGIWSRSRRAERGRASGAEPGEPRDQGTWSRSRRAERPGHLTPRKFLCSNQAGWIGERVVSGAQY